MLVREVGGVWPTKWENARNQCVRDQSQRVDIGRSGSVLTAPLFRGGIGRRERRARIIRKSAQEETTYQKQSSPDIFA